MKKFIYFLPPILWMILIFILSTRQKIAVTDSYAISFIIFKTLHIIEYATLFVLLYRGFRNAFRFSRLKSSLFSLLFVFLYGVSDEIHQSFIPTREAKVRDVIIDTIGGGVGWLCVTVFIQNSGRIPKSLVKRLGVN